MTTQIWLQKLSKGSATRDIQSKSARLLLQLACRSSGVDLNAGHLVLPGTELINRVSKDYGLDISITHCSQLVAVALGRGRLGLDCEATGRRRNWQGIADHFFTPEEASTLANVSPFDLEHIFLRHWVLKESYIKSNRGSVFGDLNRLTLANLGKMARVERCEGDNNRWGWVGSFAGCVLGIYCSHTSPPKLTFYEAASAAGTSSRAPCIKVPGSFIPVS